MAPHGFSCLADVYKLSPLRTELRRRGIDDGALLALPRLYRAAWTMSLDRGPLGQPLVLTSNTVEIGADP